MSEVLTAVNGIRQMIAQMREVAQEAGLAPSFALDAARASGETVGVGSGNFATELRTALEQVSGAQESAYAQAKAYELGEPGVSLNDVMVNAQKASLGFQMGVQVRNRLVEAYQTIAGMQV